MQGFYTPKQLSEMFGGGESTWRMRASSGEFKNAIKQGNTWFVPLRDVSRWGRGYDKEFAEPARLSPEHPTDPTDIVLAQSEDRFGIYIDDHWYGAGQALEMLRYLQTHQTWLEEKARENAREDSEE